MVPTLYIMSRCTVPYYILIDVIPDTILVSIKYSVFNGAIQIYQPSPANKTIFLAELSTSTTTRTMRKEVRIEEVLCTILESTRPVGHPFTFASSSRIPSTLACFVLVSLSPWRHNVLRRELQINPEDLSFLGRIYFIAVGLGVRW